MACVDPFLFDDVGEVARALVPHELGPLYRRSHRYGVKAWFGGDTPTKEHYEAQVVGASAVEGAKVLVVEIGFHAEHTKPADNDAAIARLLAAEAQWREELGNAAVVGPFLGRADTWRRVSETWPDPDLSQAGIAFELGTRLTDYITALEPLLRRR